MVCWKCSQVANSECPWNFAHSGPLLVKIREILLNRWWYILHDHRSTLLLPLGERLLLLVMEWKREAKWSIGIEGAWLYTTSRHNSHSCIAWHWCTGGEGAWKPTKTSWVHCRLWLKVPATYPLITDWVHSKCTHIMCSTWNLWEHLCNIWNVISTCMPHLIPHNS